MHIILSPAKTMAGTSKIKAPAGTTPRFNQEAIEIALHMAQYPAEELGRMLKLSPKLMLESYHRFQNFHSAEEEPLQALLAYTGVVFKNINPKDFTEADFRFAQDHLRLISICYGLLRPLDLIKPYRMEYDVKLPELGEGNMYIYWRARQTEPLIEEVKADDNLLINLGSMDLQPSFDWKKVEQSQTVKTNIGQIAEIGENAENAEGTAQATERAEFGLDGLVADVNIPRGTVVLAATPIGNTGDASARLIALMEGADIVAAEDTRRLYALANRLGIRVPGRVIAYHDHNERDKADGLLDQVEQGATVLVVSDAGMPTINDPGLAIIRRAIERGLPVTCAPGPSAVLDALCLSGLPTDRFCYEGFLPRKHSERVQHLRALKSERRTIVFYETLHRIDESMADLLDVFGPNRKMALCRELTKDYEQIRRGTIAEIRQSVVDDPPRGEMVLVIAGASEEEADAAAPATLSIEDLAVLSVDRAQEDNLRIKDAISQVVAEHPLSDGSLANRKQVYNAVLAMKG